MGAYVARDILMRIMPPVEAYNEDLFRDVLKAFDNLTERANEKVGVGRRRIRDSGADSRRNRIVWRDRVFGEPAHA
jgi:hypothetical protein